VLEGWNECSRMEIKGELNCGARKYSRSNFESGIPG